MFVHRREADEKQRAGVVTERDPYRFMSKEAAEEARMLADGMTEWELEEGTKALMQSLAEDNVFYAEVRFCPELHTLEGLGLDQIVELDESEGFILLGRER